MLQVNYTSKIDKQRNRQTNLQKKRSDCGCQRQGEQREKWMLLLLLSHFSRVRLCATPQTEAHQAPRPWDPPGKNTGVGCHFLLQCVKGKSESEVTQSCPTLATPWTAAYQAPLCPRDFPGKSTGVRCHCLLQEMDVGSQKVQNSSYKINIFQ